MRVCVSCAVIAASCAAALVLGAQGCSSSSGSSSSSSDPFVGNWSCTSSSMCTFTQPPGAQPSSGMGAYTISITDDGQGNIVVDQTGGDGGPFCPLKSKLDADGKTRTLVAGQMCTLANGNVQTFTMGSGTVSGNTETGMSAWTLDGKTMTGATLTGACTGNSTCTRM